LPLNNRFEKFRLSLIKMSYNTPQEPAKNADEKTAQPNENEGKPNPFIQIPSPPQPEYSQPAVSQPGFPQPGYIPPPYVNNPGQYYGPYNQPQTPYVPNQPGWAQPYGHYGSPNLYGPPPVGYQANYGAYSQGPYPVFPNQVKRPTQVELKPMKFRAWIFICLIAAIIGALIGSLIALRVENSSQQTLIKINVGPAQPAGAPVDIQSVLAKVLPATVSIYSYLANGEAAGTGMIISSDGEVLTNNHVIEGSVGVQVVLYGQTKKLDAKVIGANQAQDLAVIQILNVRNLPTVTFGNSSTLQQGDAVVAIGNALALQGGPTVTSGIISALNRSIEIQGDFGLTEHLSNLIQTDAPINPGNSGGPLVLANGQVIGINTAGATSQGLIGTYAQNIGFAIAINTVKPLLNSLINSGSPTSGRPYMGVLVENLTPQLITQHNISANSGVYVQEVFGGSPAEQAGLRSGDVIVSYNNQSVADVNQLSTDLENSKVGQTITLGIVRGSQNLKIRVILRAAAS
jgi:S1-C subfamily serine protease